LTGFGHFPFISLMKAIFKISAVLIGIAALSLVEIALMFWLGGRDVKNFCHEIRPGLPTAQLAGLAKKHDVRLGLPGSRDDSGVYLTLVHTPRSFGRHTCMVRHDNTAVIGSQYGYAD
jgi:hypothetical protein